MQKRKKFQHRFLDDLLMVNFMEVGSSGSSTSVELVFLVVLHVMFLCWPRSHILDGDSYRDQKFLICFFGFALKFEGKNGKSKAKFEQR